MAERNAVDHAESPNGSHTAELVRKISRLAGLAKDQPSSLQPQPGTEIQPRVEIAFKVDPLTPSVNGHPPEGLQTSLSQAFSQFLEKREKSPAYLSPDEAPDFVMQFKQLLNLPSDEAPDFVREIRECPESPRLEHCRIRVIFRVPV